MWYQNFAGLLCSYSDIRRVSPKPPSQSALVKDRGHALHARMHQHLSTVKENCGQIVIHCLQLISAMGSVNPAGFLSYQGETTTS